MNDNNQYIGIKLDGSYLSSLIIRRVADVIIEEWWEYTRDVDSPSLRGFALCIGEPINWIRRAMLRLPGVAADMGFELIGPSKRLTYTGKVTIPSS